MCTVSEAVCLGSLILFYYYLYILVELNVQEDFRSEESVELFNGSGDIFFLQTFDQTTAPAHLINFIFSDPSL